MKQSAGILAIGAGASFLYWMRKGFRLTCLEFLVLVTYLWSTLAVMTLGLRNRCVREGMTADGGEDEGTSGEKGKGGAAGALFELPSRVKSMLVPGLERVARAFSGDTSDGDDEGSGGDGGGGSKRGGTTIKRLDAKTMDMDPESARVKETAYAYKCVDYLLCRVKFKDPALYAKVLAKYGDDD